jgi:hypothetical protein
MRTCAIIHPLHLELETALSFIAPQPHTKPSLTCAAEYAFPRDKSRSSTGMPLGFANMTGGARYPPWLDSFSPFR